MTAISVDPTTLRNTGQLMANEGQQLDLKRESLDLVRRQIANTGYGGSLLHDLQKASTDLFNQSSRVKQLAGKYIYRADVFEHADQAGPSDAVSEANWVCPVPNSHNILMQAGSLVLNTVTGIWEWVCDKASQLLALAQQSIQLINAALALAGQKLGDAFNQTVSFIASVPQKAIDFGKGVNDWVGDRVENVVDFGKTIITGVFDFSKQAMDFFTDKAGQLLKLAEESINRIGAALQIAFEKVAGFVVDVAKFYYRYTRARMAFYLMLGEAVIGVPAWIYNKLFPPERHFVPLAVGSSQYPYRNAGSFAKKFQSLYETKNPIRVQQALDSNGNPLYREGRPVYVLILAGTQGHYDQANWWDDAFVSGTGSTSPYEASILQALRDAGVPSNAALDVVGHSQGAITAYNISAGKGPWASYRFYNVLAYGAPPPLHWSNGTNYVRYHDADDIVANYAGPVVWGGATVGASIDNYLMLIDKTILHPQQAIAVGMGFTPINYADPKTSIVQNGQNSTGLASSAHDFIIGTPPNYRDVVVENNKPGDGPTDAHDNNKYADALDKQSVGVPPDMIYSGVKDLGDYPATYNYNYTL